MEQELLYQTISEKIRVGKCVLFVSAEGARRDYGVVLSADGTAVDLEATAREREGRDSG